MSDFYDPDGNPISFERWAQLYEQRRQTFRDPKAFWRVRTDEIGPYRVSTVWIGISLAFGHGPPLIFETMVFLNDDDPKQRGRNLDSYTARYPSKESALAGHDRTVAAITAQWTEQQRLQAELDHPAGKRRE